MLRSREQSAVLGPVQVSPLPAQVPGRAASLKSSGPAPRLITILFLVDQLTELGGGERILLQIARSLPAEQFRVLIVTFRGGEDPFVWTLGLNLHIHPMRRTYGRGAINTAYKLHHLIRRYKVDLVHTFFETSDIFGSIVARLSGVRAIISSRRDMGILRSSKHDRAYRLLAPLYRAVLTVSDQVRAEVVRRDRVSPAKVRTIHNGLDLKRFTAPAAPGDFRETYGIPLHAHIVSTIANLQPWKGTDVFLRSAAHVLRTAPETQFVIAGAPSDASTSADLKSLATRLGIASSVHWIGSLQHPEDLLFESSVFCLLSRSEGFPNVVIEAMAAGVPVVATGVGGTPEAVEDGITGHLVSIGDWAAAAEHILELLEDPALGAQMGAAGRARVEARFTVDSMMANYIETYRDVMGIPGDSEAILA